MTNLLIDGDVVLYEVTTACETPVDWGDDMWTLHSDLREAKQRFDCWVSNLKDRLDVNKVHIAFSSPENWRKTILPTYKSNRKGKRKPLVFHELKQYAMDVYRSVMIDQLEGDDVLGLLAGDSKITGGTIIVSIDKDLKTIPGFHYNPMRREEGVIEVTMAQANYNHLLQTLTGDAVDGYSGCPGIGPKKAEKVLENPSWESVVSAYNKAGIEEEDALIQARVARILRYGEYDKVKKEPILWNP